MSRPPHGIDTDSSEILIPRVWRSQIPALVLFGVTLIGAVLVSRHIPSLVITGEVVRLGQYTLYLTLPLPWLLPVAILGYSIARIFDVRYTLSGRGIEARVGIMQLRQRITRVAYDDIRSIETDQSLVERFLDTGSVEIGTAATGQVEIVMSGIGSPHELRNFIEAEKDKRLNSGEQATQRMRADGRL